MAVVGGSKNGWRKVAGRMGNVFANTEFELYDLPAGEYEWTVQAINGAYLGGAFADTKTFTIQSTAVSNPVAFKPVISSIDNHLKIIVDNSALKNRIRIYEISGQLLTDEEFAGVYTKEMKSGIYLVKIENASGIVNAKVIVK